MRKVIYKWDLSIIHGLKVRMAIDAKILSVQVQDSHKGQTPVMWTEQRVEESRLVIREFVVLATGHEFEDYGLEYVGTFQINEYVWHLYENKKVIPF
jgi:hypothetical protein